MGQAAHAAKSVSAHRVSLLLMESCALQLRAPFGACFRHAGNYTGNILYADRHVHVNLCTLSLLGLAHAERLIWH